MIKARLAISLLLLGLLTTAPAKAATVIGGSTLLDTAYATQLESWLGEGSIDLTNIYTKTTGDTASSFHAAADGNGRTFTVLELQGLGGTQIVGGYIPQSWSLGGGLVSTWPDSERTAFIFNLSEGALYRQRLTDPRGGFYNLGDFQFQNASFSGGEIGFGLDDLYLSGDLLSAKSRMGSYGDDAFLFASDGTLLWPSISPYIGGSVGTIEVFTIAAVPEPEIYAMLGVGLGFMGWVARRRGKR